MMRVREVAVVAVLAGVLAWGVVPRAQEKPAEAPAFTEVQHSTRLKV